MDAVGVRRRQEKAAYGAVSTVIWVHETAAGTKDLEDQKTRAAGKVVNGTRRGTNEGAAFIEEYPEFGYQWDQENDRLKVGGRNSVGESADQCSNRSLTHHGGDDGRHVGAPLSYDAPNLNHVEEIDDNPAIDKGIAFFDPAPRTWVQQQEADAVQELLGHLKPTQEGVLRLYYFERFTLKEIARMQGVKYQAIQSRLCTARKNLEALVVAANWPVEAPPPDEETDNIVWEWFQALSRSRQAEPSRKYEGAA